eukprot:2771210-Pyramimonas_sp.AAC.1
MRCSHANPAAGTSGAAPFWAANTAGGRAQMRGRHASPATGAFGEAPFGATNRVKGAPNCGAAMRTLPLEPSAEPPMAQRMVRGSAYVVE